MFLLDVDTNVVFCLRAENDFYAGWGSSWHFLACMNMFLRARIIVAVTKCATPTAHLLSQGALTVRFGVTGRCHGAGQKNYDSIKS